MTESALHLNFSAEVNDVEPWLGQGWHGAEVGHRWTDGVSSVLRLPAFPAHPWFVLTLQCWPFNHGDLVQTLTIEMNGVTLHQYQPRGTIPNALVVPGELVRADGENVLVFHHPHAASPAHTHPGAHDARTLALAFQKLSFEPLDVPLHLAPRMLPEVKIPTEVAEGKAVVLEFQSLGRHCALGNVQRHFGAEPFGLLRFANIFPDALVTGLRMRFADIGDLDKLSFITFENSRELQGRHSVYGLDYHTFRFVDEIDVEAFAVTEAKRLAYLARLFIEQIENDEKIFVRLLDFQSDAEALALHQLLRAYNSRARLLILGGPPDHARERGGRVIELRPGLYRGYFTTTSDQTIGPSPDPQEWLRLLAAVVAYEGGRA